MTNATPLNALPPENVGRGTMFALLAVPVGIILWVLVWSIGFVASVVGFAVAAAAMFLYRFGSGGRIGRGGAVSIALITIGTLLLAFFAGMVADGIQGFTEGTDINPIAALTDSAFWNVFFDVMREPEVIGEYAPSFAIALGLGLLGCFSTLRSAFAAASQPAAEAYFAPPVYGNATAPTPADPANPPVFTYDPVAQHTDSSTRPQYGEYAPLPVQPTAGEQSGPDAPNHGSTGGQNPTQ